LHVQNTNSRGACNTPPTRLKKNDGKPEMARTEEKKTVVERDLKGM
jgi:hypothetical protein